MADLGAFLVASAVGAGVLCLGLVAGAIWLANTLDGALYAMRVAVERPSIDTLRRRIRNGR